jgi:hypothetical protein
VANGRFGKLEREGHERLELADAEPAPAPAPAAAEPPRDPIPPPRDPLQSPDAPDQPGFGTVVASGVLVACIMALVSIPVRRIFGAAGDDTELVTLVLVTLGVYWTVRRRLRRL